MYVFTIPAEKWDETNPDKRVIYALIDKHRNLVQELNKKMKYYEGEQDITADKDRANKLVCNHAKDISDTASSYFIGEPISYQSEEDISVLVDALDTTDADSVDGDNGLDMSIYGVCYEYYYINEAQEFIIKNINAESTFMVCDESIEQRELFAVYYYEEKDDSTPANTRWIATVLSQNYKWVLKLNQGGTNALVEEPEEHHLGEVPVTEFYNNKLALGDFEQQIPLLDAYNALMSDRVTDKEQFIDAILAIYGTLIADAGESETAMKELHKKKLLELPDGTRAEYITRTFDEQGVEVLAKRLEQDIHKFSHIPCMSDEAFGGNVSGVAMEYKLLGLENITKIKSRYYRKGLKKRLRIMCRYLNLMNNSVNIDYTKIKITFTRALPKNLLELSQIVSNLWGKVSKKTLLAMLPFVTDVEAELEAVNDEAEQGAELQRSIFGVYPNTTPEQEKEQDLNE